LERKVAHKTAFLAQAFIPNASEVMVHGRSNLMAKDYPADHPGQPGILSLNCKYFYQIFQPIQYYISIIYLFMYHNIIT